MTTAQLVFLYAAEELNIGRAAKRAFISQQCASNHIKNLEHQYGALLFNRKPSLSLTAAGSYLQRSLTQIQNIEQNTETSIGEIISGGVGRLSVGINPTRCRILMPPVLREFSEKYPGVEISIQCGDTIGNLELLRQGKVDLVIGINAQTFDLTTFSVTPLSADRIFFLTTKSMIEQYCSDFYEQLNADGEIPLHSLSAFPFCRNLTGSTLTHLVDTYLYQYKTKLNTRYNVSDYDTQIDLCLSGMAAAFCPSMILSRVLERNLNFSDGQQPAIFPIQEIHDNLGIDLLQNSYTFQPQFVGSFIGILEKIIRQLPTPTFFSQNRPAGSS